MSTRDWQGVRHDWGCECEKLTAERDYLRKEVEKLNEVRSNQLVFVEAERDDLKEHNEEMRQAIRDVNDKLTERDRYREALEKIAHYGTNGICPYGCDTPYIAKAALAEGGTSAESLGEKPE